MVLNPKSYKDRNFEISKLISRLHRYTLRDWSFEGSNICNLYYRTAQTCTELKVIWQTGGVHRYPIFTTSHTTHQVMRSLFAAVSVARFRSQHTRSIRDNLFFTIYFGAFPTCDSTFPLVNSDFPKHSVISISIPPVCCSLYWNISCFVVLSLFP